MLARRRSTAGSRRVRCRRRSRASSRGRTVLEPAEAVAAAWMGGRLAATIVVASASMSASRGGVAHRRDRARSTSRRSWSRRSASIRRTVDARTCAKAARFARSSRIADADAKRGDGSVARASQAWKVDWIMSDATAHCPIDRRVARCARSWTRARFVIGSVDRRPRAAVVDCTHRSSTRRRIARQSDGRRSRARRQSHRARRPDRQRADSQRDRRPRGQSLPEPPTHLAAGAAGLSRRPRRVSAQRLLRRGSRRTVRRSRRNRTSRSRRSGWRCRRTGRTRPSSTIAAWRSRGRSKRSLPPADRAYLARVRRAAVSGAVVRRGSARRVGEVVRVAPDRADGWHELGESFYYDGEIARHARRGESRAATRFVARCGSIRRSRPSRRMLTLLLRATARHRGVAPSRATAPAADRPMR